MKPLSGVGFLFVCTLFKRFLGFSKADLSLLVVALLCCFPGGEALSSVLTYVGETAILPCYITVENDNIPTVEWSKQGLSPDIVFLHRQGCETFAEKNPAYRYRTNLLVNEMKHGNLSLMISNVQPSDGGKYICKTIKKRPSVVATVELIVGVMSEPKLSVVPGGGGGVTLQCEVTCWLQPPDITFLNSQGDIVSDGDTKIYPDSSRRCFNATRRLTVQTADRFVCRVDLPATNRKRLAQIVIPDSCVGSCTTSIIITAAAVTLIMSVLCTAALLWQKKSLTLSKLSPQLSHQSSTCSDATGGPSTCPSPNLPPDQFVHSNHLQPASPASSPAPRPGTAKQLPAPTSSLQRKIHNNSPQPAASTSSNHLQPASPAPSPGPSSPASRPGSFRQLPAPTSSLQRKSHNNSPQPAASTSSNHLHPASPASSPAHSPTYRPGTAKQLPVPASSLQRKSHNNSSPAFLTVGDAVPQGPSDLASVGRSMSMSDPRARPSIVKVQRRVSTSNRYAVLTDLREDAEPLLQGKGQH